MQQSVHTNFYEVEELRPVPQARLKRFFDLRFIFSMDSMLDYLGNRGVARVV